MAGPQIIKTPSGEQLAVLPLADYERLVAAAEDAADARTCDDIRRRIATGEEERIPADYVKRIISGESPVRVFRDLRGLSAKALAEAAGISPAYLSQIESGQREGTLSTMKSLAEALGVSLDDLA